ncbi:arginase family protein [Cytobacillus sp. IB215316]|uniref:arginase family protein n=1 Tax=Cytobacillus sp. IB215316 TaxID=3097354 RepID=UPI002A0B7C39|nr:arginase family protein [Cytobacillus sp. IB215316]MDX8361513.1 arginase family protein [Cytobacillus sp. IB215316]
MTQTKYIIASKGENILLTNEQGSAFWESTYEILTKSTKSRSRNHLNSYFRYSLENNKDANIHLVGVPYNLGTQIKNSTVKDFPDILRKVSYKYPVYNEYNHQKTSGIYDYMIGTHIMKDSIIFDHGNIEIDHDVKDLEEEISSILSKFMNQKEKIGFIGGDHFITYFIVKKLLQLINTPIVLIQFDAHHDCGSDLIKRGSNDINHANFIRFLLEEENVAGIIQVGVRGLRSLGQFITHDKLHVIPSHQSNSKNLIEKLEQLQRKQGVDIPIYISFDVDVLDPSEFSLVDFPKNNGVDSKVIIDMIQSLKKYKNRLIGFDIVEGKSDGELDEYDVIIQILAHLIDIVTEKKVEE